MASSSGLLHQYSKPISVAVMVNGGAIKLGPEVPYQSADWYAKTTGIHTIKLTAEQTTAVNGNNQLVILEGDQPIIGEFFDPDNPQYNGLSLVVEDFVYRLSPDASNQVNFFASRWGEPVQDLPIIIEKIESHMERKGLLLEDEQSLKTNSEGKASFRIIGGDTAAAGKRSERAFTDSEVFSLKFLAISRDSKIPVSSPAEWFSKSDRINVLVWDKHEVPLAPTWVNDILPIFTQYANLYPVMRPMVNLRDYHSVTSNLQSLKVAFSADLDSPHYMPVIRDLSPTRRQTILNWLENPVFSKAPEIRQNIDSLDKLQQSLQVAIQLELATIPPYLCALYSLKSGHALEVVEILKSIVMEEMLHVALACNLLNAIGGKPLLDDPELIPNYPVQLPNGINESLRVTLGPLTKERIKSVFMQIEQPNEIASVDNPNDIPEVLKDFTPHEDQFTIGEFYAGIAYAFSQLCKRDGESAVFVGEPARQLKEWHSTFDRIDVTDLDSALLALGQIVDQGEGTSLTNIDNESGQPAHFYRFLEIVAGKRLALSNTQPFSYRFTDQTLPFEEADDIYPMKEQTEEFPTLAQGSQAKVLTDEFNEMYARLLTNLQATFNGQPDKINDAIGIMRNLQLKAQQLMKVKIPGDEIHTLGPNFKCHEFLPPKPEEDTDRFKLSISILPRRGFLAQRPLFNAKAELPLRSALGEFIPPHKQVDISKVSFNP